MDSALLGAPDGPWLCQRCGTLVEGRPYRHADRQVCESCYIDTWRPHHRKPHWCYLRSIKGDYLRPSPSK